MNLLDQEGAENFLRSKGIYLEESKVFRVVQVVRGKGGGSFYSLYQAKPYADGRLRSNICAKPTAQKIKKLVLDGTLDRYEEWLESQGVGPEEATPTPPESDRRSLPDNEELSLAIRQLQQSRLSLNSVETDGIEMFIALGDEFSTGIVQWQILGTLKTKLGGGNDWAKQFRAVVAPMIQENVVKPDPRGDAPLHDVYYLTDLGVRVLNQLLGAQEG